MSRLRIRIAASLLACALLPVARPGVAQYYYDPYSYDPRDEALRRQPGAGQGYDPFVEPSSRRRPRRASRDPGYEQETDPWLQNEPPRHRGARVAALPSDADPDYSTPVDLDGEIDPNETTRRVVADPTGQRPETVTIDTAARKLYLSLPDGRAVEYGIGVGRQGFAWKGVAEVGRKAFWPGWTPPREMLLRRPDLPAHMDGSMDNPLGARALYLFHGAKDTLFRIHGTNEPNTIGKAVSSGCIRMLNADIIDLYQRVRKGARVVVM